MNCANGIMLAIADILVPDWTERFHSKAPKKYICVYSHGCNVSLLLSSLHRRFYGIKMKYENASHLYRGCIEHQ